MICPNCKKEVSKTSIYCGYCGKLLEKTLEKKVCPACSLETEQDRIYCERCGTLLKDMEEKTDAEKAGSQKKEKWTVAGRNAKEKKGQKWDYKAEKDQYKEEEQYKAEEDKSISGVLLKEEKNWSLYDGEPMVGIAKASGTIQIYDKKLVYKKTMGSAIGAAFGVVGIMMAKKKMEEEGETVMEIPYTEIRKVRTGKYMGAYNTLVLELKNDDSLSFMPPFPASRLPEEIEEIIDMYME